MSTATAEKTTEDRYQAERAFTEAVRAWNVDQKGRLAILRRNAGEPIAGARAVSWIFSLLNRFERLGDEALFLTATLLAFDRPYLEGKGAFTGSFGRTMAVLKAQPGASEESLERRFAILLDADFDPREGTGELPFRLRQTVKLVLSKEGRIDWPRLLSDLRQWNHPDKYVQKHWAKDFYTTFAAEETAGTPATTQGETDAV